MPESTIIAEWMAEGEARGMAQARRSDLFEVLELRFGAPIPTDLVAAIEGQADVDVLSRWFKAALKSETLDAFRSEWEEPGIEGNIELLREDVLRLLRLKFGELPPDVVNDVGRQQDFELLLDWYIYAELVGSIGRFRLVSWHCYREYMRGNFRRILLDTRECVGRPQDHLRRARSPQDDQSGSVPGG
jgi:hypothetical protein